MTQCRVAAERVLFDNTNEAFNPTWIQNGGTVHFRGSVHSIESGFPWRGSFPRPHREKVVPIGTRVKGLTPLPTNLKVLNPHTSQMTRGSCSAMINGEAPVERYLLEQSGRYSRRGIDFLSSNKGRRRAN